MVKLIYNKTTEVMEMAMMVLKGSSKEVSKRLAELMEEYGRELTVKEIIELQKARA